MPLLYMLTADQLISGYKYFDLAVHTSGDSFHARPRQSESPILGAYGHPRTYGLPLVSCYRNLLASVYAKSD